MALPIDAPLSVGSESGDGYPTAGAFLAVDGVWSPLTPEHAVRFVLNSSGALQPVLYLGQNPAPGKILLSLYIGNI